MSLSAMSDCISFGLDKPPSFLIVSEKVKYCPPRLISLLEVSRTEILVCHLSGNSALQIGVFFS